ncbi:MAG: hypothetical protein HOQ43_10815 [Glycomyces artemisiae]|uniref:Uncharacterized protein n=1 Tax=Glycomyces artemisiae TaxID=1076443 RepID=A0A850C7S1_9ACTN|nr:hypothetical protein [Glycomyces artemisiae]
MARIRTLKPTRFTSRSLARCPRDARTTFEGMWCEADDHGRGIADARLLKGAIWPLDDDITHLHVFAFVDVLAATGHIRLYQVDGEAYYEVVNWERHQAAAYRRGEPKYPPPSAGQPLASLSAHEGVQESASRTQMGAGTGNREQGEGKELPREPQAEPQPPTPVHAPADAVASDEAVDGEIVDDNRTSRERILDQLLDEPPNAGLIVKGFIDRCRAAGFDLPDSLVGRYGKAIKEQLGRFDANLIKAALDIMINERITDRPHLLASKIVVAQAGPALPPARAQRSTTDERVHGWLTLGDDTGPFAAIGGAA